MIGGAIFVFATSTRVDRVKFPRQQNQVPIFAIGCKMDGLV